MTGYEFLEKSKVVQGACGHCAAFVTFENKGTIQASYPASAATGQQQILDIWFLLGCPGCQRASLALVINSGRNQNGPETEVSEFYPRVGPKASLPDGVPEEIEEELREAETCIAAGAPRGAAALLRSTLEKALNEDGYTETTLKKRGLKAKIYAAAEDGVLTQPRKVRAEAIVKSLGDEVLHNDWRELSDKEVADAHHYVQRILEDLYDDRETVKGILKTAMKKRNPPAKT
jgi:hypothetical protein